MRKRALTAALSVLVNLGACMAANVVALAMQDWFGSGDSWSLLFWTLALSVGLAFGGTALLDLVPLSSKPLRVLYVVLLASLISFGFVYLVFLIIGPWINAFSVPILILWFVGSFAQLLFLDRTRSTQVEKRSWWKVTLRILLIPVGMFGTVAVLMSISLAVAFLTKPEKETYLIPADFSGKVTVIYGEECAPDPVYENGRRLMVVPENGVVIVKPEFEAGIIDNLYYLVDEYGERRELEHVYDRGSDEDGINFGGSGSASTSSASGDNVGQVMNEITFGFFYVQNFQAKYFSDLDRDAHFELVDECRESIDL